MDIYALELIRQLQKLDTHNEYYIFVKPGEDHDCLQETDNFHIVELKGFTYLDWEQWSLPRAVNRLDLDILHCTSNTAPLFCKAPIYLTLHDIIYLHKGFGGGSMYQRLGHYYRKWIVPQVFHTAERVFTVSRFEKDQINDYFGKSGKVDVIYNGVAPKFTTPTVGKLKKIRKDLDLPEKYLFFLGNTAPKKNMLNMLKAYSIYVSETSNPLPLLVAESSEEELKAMIYQAGLSSELLKNIRLTGYIHHDWLPAVYAMAATFIYPSLRESFGIPIIEAMACGTPVITSDSSSMPEVAGECAVLVNPKDPNDLAKKIMAVTQIPQFQEKLIQGGLERAEAFTWEETARKTLLSYITVATPVTKTE